MFLVPDGPLGLALRGVFDVRLIEDHVGSFKVMLFIMASTILVTDVHALPYSAPPRYVAPPLPPSI